MGSEALVSPLLCLASNERSAVRACPHASPLDGAVKDEADPAILLLTLDDFGELRARVTLNLSSTCAQAVPQQNDLLAFLDERFQKIVGLRQRGMHVSCQEQRDEESSVHSKVTGGKKQRSLRRCVA